MTHVSVLLLIGLAVAAAASPGAAASGAVVTMDGNGLSVRVDQELLSEVLETVGRQAGVRIVGRVADERVSMAFAPVPLETGVKRLIGRYSALFLYTANGVLEEIRVYGPGDAPMVPRSSPGAATPPAPRPALTDPDPAGRVAAALALAGGAEAETALNVVLDLLTTHSEAGVREQALAALAFFGDVPLAPITEVALFDLQPSLRAAATEFLRSRAARDPEARSALAYVATLAADRR